MNRLKCNIAKVVSYLFHPIFMPTNGLLLVFFTGSVGGFNLYSTNFDKKNVCIVLTSVFIATTILPLLVAVLLKKFKLVSSLQMENKEERVFPFFLTGIFYLSVISIILFYFKIPLHWLITSFMKGATLSIFVGMIITASWKISIHMIGIGGILGTFILLSKFGNTVHFGIISAVIIAAGLIAFSRLQLKAHDEKQLLAGFLLGLICQLLPLLVR